jgi:hypothetical protein
VWIAAIGALLIVGLPIGCGDDVRYFEQNGKTYRETRRDAEPRMVSQQPPAAPDARIPQQGQAAAPGPLVAQTQEMVRTYWVPVTEYSWEPYWVNRWNPFAEPYVAYRYVGRMHWEQRTEIVRVPVICRRDGQPSIVLPPPPGATPLTAHRGQFGGIGRVGDEPPR